MRSDSPDVSGWVRYSAVAFPRLHLIRLDYRGPAGFDCLLVDGIAVLHVELQFTEQREMSA